MKKIIVIAIAAIFFTTVTRAQDSSSMNRMKMNHPAKMQRTQMFDELNLTADQKEKMKQMRADNMTKMNDIKNNTSLNDDQKEEQIKSLRMEERKGMMGLLTDDQKAKMKDMRQSKMKDRNGKMNDSDSTSHR